MWKNRLGYGLMLAALAVMICFFGKIFLICVFVGMIGMLILLKLLMHRDQQYIEVDFKVSPGCKEGEKVRGILKVGSDHRILAAQWMTVNLEVSNKMFGFTEYRQLEIGLKHHESQYVFEVPAEWCGVTDIICQMVQIEDVFRLFRREMQPFEAVSTTIYPRGCGITVEMSKTTIGAAKDEGKMQNRRGNDPSEIFDIKEYVPGDDLRFVHWKLSAKADHLIMRLPSEPTHYHAVLLPDLGLTQDGAVVTREELNMAVSVGAAICEQMLQQGASFCVAIPQKTGLDICEISNIREFRRIQQQWLGTPISAESGQGLKYFMLQHLEENFTRLLILTAGHYSEEIAALEKRIGVTVVCTVSEPAIAAGGAQTNSEIVEIPADAFEKETYRIIC